MSGRADIYNKSDRLTLIYDMILSFSQMGVNVFWAFLGDKSPLKLNFPLSEPFCEQGVVFFHLMHVSNGPMGFRHPSFLFRYHPFSLRKWSRIAANFRLLAARRCNIPASYFFTLDIRIRALSLVALIPPRVGEQIGASIVFRNTGIVNMQIDDLYIPRHEALITKVMLPIIPHHK